MAPAVYGTKKSGYDRALNKQTVKDAYPFIPWLAKFRIASSKCILLWTGIRSIGIDLIPVQSKMHLEEVFSVN